MDAISIIKNRIHNSSHRDGLNHFKDSVLYDIYGHLTYNDAVHITLTEIILLKNNFIKSKTSKVIRAYSLEFYLIRGWAIDEAKKKISELQRNNSLKFSKKRKENPENYNHIKSPMSIDFWLNKGYSLHDAKEKIKSQRPVSMLFWLKKGYSLHDAKKEVKKHQSNAGNVFSKKLKENPNEYVGYLNNQIEWWLNQGYSLEEAKEKLKERQITFTLEKCIKKHGEELGIQIFNERQDKWKKSLQENFEREGDGRSPSSQFANSVIKELCAYLGIKIPKKEKWIQDKENKNAYSYDFTYNKKIIEFNGDYWHCNPNLYEADFFNKNKGLSAKQIWDYDLEKLKTAEKYGYQVLVVWERDWIENPKQCIEKCKIFLTKKKIYD